MKDIKGYEGLYKISRDGKVWSCRLQRYLVPTTNTYGYLSVVLQKPPYKRKRFLIHRLIAIHYISNPKLLPQINHVNGIKTDNRIENLEWCTCKHNIHHAYATGLNRKAKPEPMPGEKNPRAKFTNKQVAYIRRLHAKGISQAQLVKQYSVSWRTIQKIVYNMSYIAPDAYPY